MPHRTGLSKVQLSLVQAPIQRTDRHPVQRSPVPHRHRAARRVVAPPLQAQLPRRRRDAPPARLEVTHETIRAWEFRFAPLLADQLRTRRRGRTGESWYLDETYVKVSGRCLYRAIDRDGELLDSMLSEHRDKHAARRFLRRLVEVAGRKPLRVTTDKHPAYRRAIRWIIGRRATHRTTQYLNNYTEQSHRAVKQRDYLSDHIIGSRRDSRCVSGPRQPARSDDPNLRSNIVAPQALSAASRRPARRTPTPDSPAAPAVAAPPETGGANSNCCTRRSRAGVGTLAPPVTARLRRTAAKSPRPS